MFSDLRQFDEAKRWADEYARTRGDSASVTELIHRQAQWSEEVRNYDAAAEMYIKVRLLGMCLEGMSWRGAHSSGVISKYIAMHRPVCILATHMGN